MICGNDLLVVGVLLEAQQRGLCVPSDLSVVDIDDLEIASRIPSSLTIIRLPMAELGRPVGEHRIASPTLTGQ